LPRRFGWMHSHGVSRGGGVILLIYQNELPTPAFRTRVEREKSLRLRWFVSASGMCRRDVGPAARMLVGNDQETPRRRESRSAARRAHAGNGMNAARSRVYRGASDRYSELGLQTMTKDSGWAGATSNAPGTGRSKRALCPRAERVAWAVVGGRGRRPRSPARG
jgi:hypothetical protein